MATKKKSIGSTMLRKNKLIYAAIAMSAVVLFLGVLQLLRSQIQTETYYTLSKDVATRTQITPDMLSPVTVSKSGAPKAAKTIGDVQSGSLYSKYPLLAGDILTNSNAGALEDISTGVPDNWVITSFSVPADNAVGGRIHRGVYFDFMVGGKDGSYYPFINMLCLDTSVSLNGASNNNAADTDEAKSGQTSLYTVGLPPQDAARLQQIMKDRGGDVRLVLSPRQNEYSKPQVSAYTGVFKYENDAPKDESKGTDYTFTPLERDAFGRPTKTSDANCSAGNAKLTTEECKKAAQTTTTPSDTSSNTN